MRSRYTPVFQTLFYLQLALVAILFGITYVLRPSMRARAEGVGLFIVAVICVVLSDPQIRLAVFTRRKQRRDGPSFEVGDPHAPEPSAGATPLIEAMQRVRGKRPPRDEDE